MSKSSPAICEALKGQIAELQGAALRAEMADHVYDLYASPGSVAAPPSFNSCIPHKSTVPQQFTLISDSREEMRKLLSDAKNEDTIHQLIDPAQSDYRVAIYRDEQTKKIFVVFRGTQSKDDMLNADVPQQFGERTEYYSKAAALARLLKQSPDVQEHGIEFIGHSLGGGLAAAAGLEACGPALPSAPPRRWKCNATTFNPAGVHLNTASGKDLPSAEGYIDAYVVEDEPLNSSQDNRARTFNGVTAISVLAAPLTGGMTAMVPAWVATKAAGYIHPFSFWIGPRAETKISSIRHGVTEITLSDGRLVRATLHVNSVKVLLNKPETLDGSYNVIAEVIATPEMPLRGVHETVQ